MAATLFEIFLFTACFFLAPAISMAEDADLNVRLDALEKQVAELNEKLNAQEKKSANENVARFKINGEYRNRAQIQTNTVNNYTNVNGKTLNAYEPGGTTSHDYGWWDQRLQINTETTFYS